MEKQEEKKLDYTIVPKKIKQKEEKKEEPKKIKQEEKPEKKQEAIGLSPEEGISHIPYKKQKPRQPIH